MLLTVQGTRLSQSHHVDEREEDEAGDEDGEEAEEEEEVEEKVHFNIIEDPAEFPGGDKALNAYIHNNIKYPVIAQENGVQGKVYVTFVVKEVNIGKNGTEFSIPFFSDF